MALGLRYCIFLVLIFLGSIATISGQALKGKVVSPEGEPLAFVNILVNQKAERGVTSDIDGKFEIRNFQKIQSLLFKYVGFEDLILNVNELSNLENIKVVLNPTAYLLSEATVVAGENPAHRIIRMAVDRRDEHNPIKLKSYQCTIYNKLVGDFFSPIPKEEKEEKFKEKGKLALKLDSLFQKRADHFLGQGKERHLFLMESEVEKSFLAPRHELEKIKKNRISGIQSPTFTALAHSLQPFAFYGDFMDVLGQNYLNPISPNSEQLYFFNLVDTLYESRGDVQDSIFVIAFEPKKGKNFDALKGVLSIHTNGFALKNIRAIPANPTQIDLVIEQAYICTNEQWFPEQLNIEIVASNYPSSKLGSKISGRTYIGRVNINPELRLKDFPLDGIEILDKEVKASDEAWEGVRVEPLTMKETTTYRVLDSLGAESKIDRRIKLFNAILQGKLKIGPVDWDLTRIARANDLEGIRPGVALVTNDDLIKNLKLGAYLGYGIRDSRFKYSADLSWMIIPRRLGQLQLFYGKDVLEPGRFEIDQPDELLTSRVYAARMDVLDSYGGKFGAYLLPYTYFDFRYVHQTFEPTYLYSYKEGETEFTRFNVAEIGLDIRYSFAEKFTEIFGRRIRQKSNFPSLHVAYRKGVRNGFGEWGYDQVKMNFEGQVKIRRFGFTDFALQAGWVGAELGAGRRPSLVPSENSGVPLAKLFSTNGLNNDFNILIEELGFKTMLPYEFLSDQFAFLFIKHDFGNLLGTSKYSRPHFNVEHNMGWGKLASEQSFPDNSHQGIIYKTLENGYYETGVVVENLLSINYLNIGYVGVGLGAFYRYGPYQFSDPNDNWTFKLTLNFEVL